MKKLELPPTLHIARLDEVPNKQSLREAILASETANLTPGYVVNHNIPQDSLFSFFAEINIDNSNLWQLVKALLAIFPEKVSFIFGHIDHNLSFSPYEDKDEIYKSIAKYESELVKDGFLEYGFIYQDTEILQEIFIKKAKYIQFWGNDISEFEEVMKAFSLYETEGLNFIDEYPMVTESLSLTEPKARDTSSVIADFTDIFKKTAGL